MFLARRAEFLGPESVLIKLSDPAEAESFGRIFVQTGIVECRLLQLGELFVGDGEAVAFEQKPGPGHEGVECRELCRGIACSRQGGDQEGAGQISG